jgi:hypothetical protein
VENAEGLACDERHGDAYAYRREGANDPREPDHLTRFIKD